MERRSRTSQLEINMTNVELQDRVKEQEAAHKQAKLKYRGVAYLLKKTD